MSATIVPVAVLAIPSASPCKKRVVNKKLIPKGIKYNRDVAINEINPIYNIFLLQTCELIQRLNNRLIIVQIIKFPVVRPAVFSEHLICSIPIQVMVITKG